MKTCAAVGLLFLLAKSAHGDVKTIELPFKSHDGYAMIGKLTVPETGKPGAVLIYVQCAEGMTVDMKRPNGSGGTFNYFDLYGQKLPEMNVAFFSYEGRGIRMGPNPPRYEVIDRAIYDTSTLDNKVRDLLSAVDAVSKQLRLPASRIYLMGASEGTLLVSEAASRMKEKPGALILYGVMSANMREIFRYINTSGALLTWRGYFDTDRDGRISRAEFEADPAKFRANTLKNAPFEAIDKNGDGYFTVEDIAQLSKPILDAIDKEDYVVLDQWTTGPSPAVATPKGWFKDHFTHAPIWTFLSKLDIPVGCFHGDRDAMTPIDGLRKLEEQAKTAGKSKMEFHYFKGLDHSLNIALYFIRNTMPDGHRAIFEFIRRQVGISATNGGM